MLLFLCRLHNPRAWNSKIRNASRAFYQKFPILLKFFSVIVEILYRNLRAENRVNPSCKST